MWLRVVMGGYRWLGLVTRIRGGYGVVTDGYGWL